MFLKNKATGDLVEILDMDALIDPYSDGLMGRYHYGEEMQEPERYAKRDLLFPSGESLPRCWIDSDYRGTEVQRRQS